MKRNIFLVRVLLLSIVVCHSTVSALQEQQQPQLQVPGTPLNYVIKFFGIQHDYQNESEAKSSLAQKLQTLTGYPIVVDSLDSTDGTRSLATWHATNVTDCAEQEVNRLLENIRLPDGSFTREYKMLFNQEFSPPSRVEVEWLGPCENLARKRAMPTGQQEASTTSASTTTTTTTTTVETTPPSMPTTSLAPELPPPTTTTEPAPTTTTMTNTIPEQPVTEATEASLYVMNPITTTEAPPTTTTTMATTTTTMTTTTTTTEPPPPPPPTTTTTTTEPPTTSTTTTTEAPTTTSTTTEIPLPPPSIVSTITEPIESAPVVAPDNAASSAKYIGLGAAFGLSIVYLICARAYRRQGMYELNTET